MISKFMWKHLASYYYLLSTRFSTYIVGETKISSVFFVFFYLTMGLTFRFEMLVTFKFLDDQIYFILCVQV